MSSSILAGNKRKRDNGAEMPKLHTVIDQDTGEVYHVETTRQAKKRHQRNGAAQYQPTVGQLNAADIWNRQEEKIKRDKEREERRKKNKLRQDAKDQKSKELQQELLQKGKIRLEDTWGKVTASQNRLNSYFGNAARPSAPILGAEETEISSCDREDQAPTACHHDEDRGHQEQDSTVLEDLDNFFTDSPLSPVINKSLVKQNHSFMAETIVPFNDVEMSDAQIETSQNILMRNTPPTTRELMPPPPLPQISPSAMHQSTESLATHKNPTNHLSQTLTGTRSPLRELTASEVILRTEEMSDTQDRTEENDGHYFVASQVVRDAIAVICSQDLEDDFGGDEKENVLSPPTRQGCDPVLEEYKSASKKRSASANSKDDFEDSGFEEFDDEGLDDESLLSLAATQRLKFDLFASSRRARLSVTNDVLTSDSPIHQNPCKLNHSASFTSRSSDSFANDGLGDDEMLQNLEDFEKHSRILEDSIDHFDFEAGDEERPSTGSMKKRRVLPWIKNPLPSSFDRDAEDAFDLASPSNSQSAGD